MPGPTDGQAARRPVIPIPAARRQPELRAAVDPLVGHLVEAEQTAADRDEFIAVKKWTLDGRILTAGVIQQDTDLPVMVVVALEETAPA